MSESNFAGNLRGALKAAELTQAQLAEQTGCTQPDISRYLSAGRIPSGDKLVAIARALGTTAETLITGRAIAYNALDDGEPLPAKQRVNPEKARRLAARAAEALGALREELEKEG